MKLKEVLNSNDLNEFEKYIQSKKSGASALLFLAIENNNVLCLDFFCKKYPGFVVGREEFLASEAVLYSSFDIIKYLFENKIAKFSSYRLLFFAIEEKNLDILRYLVEVVKLPLTSNNMKIYEECFAIAARNGSLDIIQFLREEKGLIPKTKKVIKNSILSEDDKIFQYLIKKCGYKIEGEEKNLFFSAIKNGNLPIVKNLIQNYNVDPKIEQNYGLILAIQTKNFNIIKTLIEEYNVPIGEKEISIACETGDTKIVEYFYNILHFDLEKFSSKIKNPDLALYAISNKVWAEKFDKVISLTLLKNCNYLSNHNFLETFYSNTTCKNKKHFLTKIIKQNNEQNKSVLINTI